MGCTLDFLSYQYASDTPVVQSDGHLTVEFAEMERYAQMGATNNIVNDYWCDIASRPELLCLDIAGPGTLGNSLNTTTFNMLSDTVFSNGNFIMDTYATADETSLNLFGQYNQCDGKTAGDGLINVFDIATVIAYIFKDYRYADLNPNPEQVITVQCRDRLASRCESVTTRAEYMALYADDTCVYFDAGCDGTLRFTTGCGNGNDVSMSGQIHPYSNTLTSDEKRSICAFECEVRGCINFEVTTSECLTYMGVCTDAGSTSGLLKDVYEATYSCHHDNLPAPPPSPPARRLQQLQSGTTAQEIFNRWQSMPPLTPVPAPVTTRAWLPAIASRHDVVNVPPRQLSLAHHTFLPEYDHPTGRWYTLRTASVSIRLHAVLTGLPSNFVTEAKVSNRLYDGTPPQDPTVREVRFTRFCEFGNCDDTCAVIEPVHPSRTAMLHNTLELMQRPIRNACPYEVHVWVPYVSSTSVSDRCVGVEYLTIADGVRGQFARDTACTRDIAHPPPPSPLYVGLPRPPPSPRMPPAPIVTYFPPPPPNASAPIASPPPVSEDDRSWVWVVSVTVLVLACGFCCVALAVTRRRREEDQPPVMTTLVVPRRAGLGSANPNVSLPRSNGHMVPRGDVEMQIPAPQANRYPRTEPNDPQHGSGLAPRRAPRPLINDVARNDLRV